MTAVLRGSTAPADAEKSEKKIFQTASAGGLRFLLKRPLSMLAAMGFADRTVAADALLSHTYCHSMSPEQLSEDCRPTN